MSFDDDLAWLRGQPPIDELIARFPREWDELRRGAARRHARGGDDAVRQYVAEALATDRGRPRDRAAPRRQQITQEVQRRMLLELIRQRNLAIETGRTSGTVRFNRLNGLLLQRLFFVGSGLVRKPVSLAAYRICWPLASQRRLLLPLVRPHGIYCFFSEQFLRGLRDLVGDRTCVEIAAGDGTLTRFLVGIGVPVRASDDYSWAAHVDYDRELVERMDAMTALRRHQPEVVICSWPPPGNTFEKRVFLAPSVQTYLVVVSSSDADAGDWATYLRQDEFDMAVDESLSRQVLPRGSSRVLVFHRRE